MLFVFNNYSVCYNTCNIFKLDLGFLGTHPLYGAMLDTFKQSGLA